MGPLLREQDMLLFVQAEKHTCLSAKETQVIAVMFVTFLSNENNSVPCLTETGSMYLRTSCMVSSVAGITNNCPFKHWAKAPTKVKAYKKSTLDN